VVDWITIDLKARWRIVGYALKSRLHENSENQKTEETNSTVAPGARRPPEMAVASVDWRGAQGIWRQAPARSQIVQFRFFFVQILWKKICFEGYLTWIMFYFKENLFLLFRHIFFINGG